MKLIDKIFSTLAPNSCLYCTQEGSILCEWCSEDALPAILSRCYLCNALTSSDSLCKKCRPKSSLHKLYIRSEYKDYSKDLIHAMKFRYSLEATRVIARELIDVIPFCDQSCTQTWV